MYKCTTFILCNTKVSNNFSKELAQQTFLPCKRYIYSAKVNWQNQHLQNVEDEGFNSFDRTHIQAMWKIWGQGGHIGTVGDLWGQEGFLPSLF